MPDLTQPDIEELIERAQSQRLIQYNRVSEETITFQFGRVLYAMEKNRAANFLKDALQWRTRLLQD